MLMSKIDLQKLLTIIEQELQTKIHFHYDELGDIPTYYLESNSFELSFWIDDDEFVIGNLEVYDKKQGTGSKVVEEIINYAKYNSLESIKANKVKTDAISYWEYLGFECDDEHCYYEL